MNTEISYQKIRATDKQSGETIDLSTDYNRLKPKWRIYSMIKKTLILSNLLLLLVLLFIIGYFYILKDDVGSEHNKQYTLLLKYNETEQTANEIKREGLEVTSGLVDHVNSIVKQEKRVSFLITDLGLDHKVTKDVVSTFSQEISLGFSPFAQNLEGLIDSVNENDILLNLPVNDNLQDTKIALDNELSEEENFKRLSLILSRGRSKYSGVYTKINQNFSFKNSAISKIMKTLEQENKFLCYGSIDKVTKYLAKEKNVKFITPDLIIEYNFDKGNIEEKLALISVMQEYQNNLLVIIEPSAIAIESLSEFLSKEHNFKLVKISDMVE